MNTKNHTPKKLRNYQEKAVKKISKYFNENRGDKGKLIMAS